MKQRFFPRFTISFSMVRVPVRAVFSITAILAGMLSSPVLSTQAQYPAELRSTKTIESESTNGYRDAYRAPHISSAAGALSDLSIPFISNTGQLDHRVAFYANTSAAGTLFVTRDGKLVYALPAAQNRRAKDDRYPRGTTRVSQPKSGWTLVERFVGGQPKPSTGAAAATRVSRFIGNDPSKWATNLSTHNSIKLGEVWPGIEVELHAKHGRIEKYFTVQPGADLNKIKLKVDGAQRLTVRDEQLIVQTSLGNVTLSKPMAWQEVDGLRQPIQVAYKQAKNTYGFNLGEHDPAHPVIIDPILQATYLGGSANETAASLAATEYGVYVFGRTQSRDFPGTKGGYQPAYGGGASDVYIAWFDLELQTLLNATYLGGSGFEERGQLAFDAQTKTIYIAGETSSRDFPITEGTFQQTLRGGSDGFIARFDLTLSKLLQSTYLGGSDLDTIDKLTLFGGKGLYVGGLTVSRDFPKTAGGAQPSYGGGSQDVFVAVLDSELTTLYQATYLGGSGGDQIGNLRFNDDGVYIAGSTDSVNFPGTEYGAQPTYGGGTLDGFIAWLDPTLAALQATYLGGNDSEGPTDLIVWEGLIFVVGSTASRDFPGTNGGAQPVLNGVRDAFVTWLDPSLAMIGQSTYLGGREIDTASSIIISEKGELYIGGATSSPDFPRTAGGAQAVNGGGLDAYFARLDTNLMQIIQATYYGGSGGDNLSAGIALFGDWVYGVGVTNSPDLPRTMGGAQPRIGGGIDAYAVRLTKDLRALPIQ